MTIEPLRFFRGHHAYIVGRAYEGEGYVGLRDGKVIVRDAERAVVARVLIMGHPTGCTLPSIKPATGA